MKCSEIGFTEPQQTNTKYNLSGISLPAIILRITVIGHVASIAKHVTIFCSHGTMHFITETGMQQFTQVPCDQLRAFIDLGI